MLQDDLLRSPTSAEAPCILIEKDEQQQLIHLVHRLEEELREVVLLHYFDELTYDQIAQWLGIARSTVNERLAKSRHRLKTLLSDRGQLK